jgi:sulfatase maturation enzyme AslB (radical SAM superfamily)
MDIYITEKCNANCNNCFNRKFRSNNEISISDFKQLCAYLRNNGCENVRLMGGEPTIHSRFKEMAKIAQDYFSEVRLLTNALGNGIFDFNPREEDNIVYNFACVGYDFQLTKMLFEKPGKRELSIVVSKNTDTTELIHKLNSIFSTDDLINRIEIGLHLDATCDVFLDSSWAKTKIDTLAIYFLAKKWRFGFPKDGDRSQLFPHCFPEENQLLYGTATSNICGITEPKVINANLDFLFCESFPVKVSSLFENDQIIEWDELQKRTSIIRNKRLKITETRCEKCLDYLVTCDGTCFGLTGLKGFHEMCINRKS